MPIRMTARQAAALQKQAAAATAPPRARRTRAQMLDDARRRQAQARTPLERAQWERVVAQLEREATCHEDQPASIQPTGKRSPRA